MEARRTSTESFCSWLGPGADQSGRVSIVSVIKLVHPCSTDESTTSVIIAEKEEKEERERGMGELGEAYIWGQYFS